MTFDSIRRIFGLEFNEISMSLKSSNNSSGGRSTSNGRSCIDREWFPVDKWFAPGMSEGHSSNDSDLKG